MINEILKNLPTIGDIKTFILTQTKHNQFFQTAGFFGILGAIGMYLKSFPKYIWKRLERRLKFEVNIEETTELYEYFEFWLYKHRKSSYRNVGAKIEIKEDLDAYGDREEVIKYNQYEDSFIIRRGIWYIHIEKGREKLENANDISTVFFNRFTLTSWFSKNIITKLLEEVKEYHNKIKFEDKKEVNIYIQATFGWYRSNVIVPKTIDKVFIENKEDIIKDFDTFLTSKEWYRNKGISYKRGYIFYGPPGNGKTSLGIALSRKYNRDIYFLSLNNMTDESLNTAFRELSPRSILMIEDIDTIFDVRSSIKNKNNINSTKVNFGTLLNCLDGVFSKENVVVIFTTNHIEKLDPALIRAGRIDKKFKISNPNKNIIEMYFNSFFELSSDNKLFNKKDCYIENEIPMSEIQNICLVNKNSPEIAKKEILRELRYKKK